MADPRKDPYYKDAYSTENAYLNDFLKNWTVSKNNALKQEQEEIQIEEARRGQKMRTKLSEVLAAGGEGEISDRIKPVLAEYGDVDTLLKFENQDRLEESGEASRKQQQMNAIFKIAEVHPELATQMWNANFGEMGMMTPEQFQKPPQIKSGPGMLYHVGKDGKIVVDYERPEKEPKGEKVKKERFLDSSGALVYVDEDTPEGEQRILQERLKPYSAGGTESAAEKMMAQFMSEALGVPLPGVTPSPMTPTSPAPSALPTPTATPKPKKRVMVMPKGISQ